MEEIPTLGAALAKASWYLHIRHKGGDSDTLAKTHRHVEHDVHAP